MDNMKVWDAVKQPPKEAMKIIQGGRLKGMTDISPQWRYRIMTEQFGMCGIGWKYEADVWTEPASDEQVFAFARVKLYIFVNDKWSDPIPGIGGSMLVTKEQAGLHASDEGFKMAITDALSVAMKMLGVGANVYAGLTDETKHQPTKDSAITPGQQKELYALAEEKKYEKTVVQAVMVLKFKKGESKDLTQKEATELIKMMKSGEGFPQE